MRSGPKYKLRNYIQRLEMPEYNLEEYDLKLLKDLPCTNINLKTFSRAHYSYINQIFGDITIRDIIQEIYKKSGKLIVEKSGRDFTNSYHHVLKKSKMLKICSVDEGYQNIKEDINDTLCQSYSLMDYLGYKFNKKASTEATVEEKKSKQMVMIQMYRDIINNPEFLNILLKEIVVTANKDLWTDTTDHTNETKIIKTHLKNKSGLVNKIRFVLDAWENYGWHFFIGRGTCFPPKKGGRITLRKRRTNL